jgi:energy-coupling factor transport system ATP-binding protein
MALRLRIKDLSIQYSATEPKALSSLSLEVEAGSCCAVLGPTGAGKSTLLQCLAGIMRRHHPDSIATGRIQMGETWFEGIPDHILFPTAGLVLQDPYVQISGVRDTVIDEVLFTLENLRTVLQDPRETVASLLQGLGIEHLADRRPTSLSGGETQSVALATILIAQPPVLLLDEPTTALDSNAREKLGLILHSLRGKTTVLITDTQIDFALSVADRIFLLDQGAISFEGNPKSLISHLGDFSSILPVENWLRAQPLFSSLENPSGHARLMTKALGLP